MNLSHAIDCVLAALEIQRLMREIKRIKTQLGFEYWELRLGIHSGSLIAGVIGQDKFAYNIWGDTVNTASRMESSGEVGEVNISENTYQLVKEYFVCEFRGEINAKNKGNVRMYFVKNIQKEFSVNAEGLVPNSKFLDTIERLRASVR
jgi:adenylate cyclase